ncbi:hypothetical protein RHOFW104T7_12525 [Rhodanobacter thiooxydans]|uniref:Zinc ribbon domain-containing protein n=2 Tax=Rhodanobacter thiooxydans TaxID=416169 RepID=A0A154QHP7_9GAMM|nr:hypothetical protein UUA_16148 [Rhodanobacter thiooxydans LCS2]KZC23708.1 hypothetical protein RHOFW104T7_12525 [Rhodanobacter thiooxydans]
MAYEYNADSRQLDFPNPFYAENWFLVAASVMLSGGGIGLLLLSRGAIAGGHGLRSVLPLLLGIGLLVAGLNQGRRVLMQLRFFFGRSRPAGLAPELTADATGRSGGSDELKETLRQNALSYPEPQGPLNNLLHAGIRNLIFAPRPVQFIAQRQFQTAIAIVVTLLSFLVAWLGFGNGKAADWMGLFYFGFSVLLLLRPLESGVAAPANVGMRGLIGLILAAIFVPVLLPFVASGLPSLDWLSLNVQTLFLLLAALLGVGLYFVALMHQMTGLPPTNMAREQTSLSMNCHPKQLLDELDRTLQDTWVERIPNRRYAKTVPLIGSGAGTFAAELVEETQPMSGTGQNRVEPGAAFTMPRYRFIAWLDVVGVALIALGVAWLLVFGAKFRPEVVDVHLFSLLTLGLAMLVVGHYCLRAGHVLWGRFDFVSRLVWVEMQGNYQSAQMNFGNTFTDRVKTEKQLINIETMTLRVWAAELDSVIFGKNAQRFIVGLRGVPDYARQLAAHLVDFAQEQSVIVAPTSRTDMQKSAVLGAMNRLGGQADAALPQAMMQAIQGATTPPPTPLPATITPPYCSGCQTPVNAADRFCGNCGHALAGAG